MDSKSKVSVPNLTIGILSRAADSYVLDAVRSASGITNEILVLGPSPVKCEVEEIRWEPYTWPDNFSTARNALNNLSSNDWVLHLDSDETLDPSAVPLLRQVVSQEQTIVKISVLLEEARVLLPRLVPKTAEWRRPVHEIPRHPGGTREEQRIHIHHRQLSPQERGDRLIANYYLIRNELESTKDPELLFLSAIDASFFNHQLARELATEYLKTFKSISSRKGRIQRDLMEYVIAFLDGRAGIDRKAATQRVRRLLYRRPDFAEKNRIP